MTNFQLAILVKTLGLCFSGLGVILGPPGTNPELILKPLRELIGQLRDSTPTGQKIPE